MRSTKQLVRRSSRHDSRLLATAGCQSGKNTHARCRTEQQNKPGMPVPAATTQRPLWILGLNQRGKQKRFPPP